MKFKPAAEISKFKNKNFCDFSWKFLILENFWFRKFLILEKNRFSKIFGFGKNLIFENFWFLKRLRRAFNFTNWNNDTKRTEFQSFCSLFLFLLCLEPCKYHSNFQISFWKTHPCKFYEELFIFVQNRVVS